MDPDANLFEQERILVSGYAAGCTAPYVLAGDQIARLRELRRALAGWLAGGGLAPDWRKAPHASRHYLCDQSCGCFDNGCQ